MSRRKRRRHPPGTSPGTLVSVPGAPAPRLRAILYGPGLCDERASVTLEEVAALRGRAPVLWVDVEGLGDARVIERLGEIFGLHRLALEDVVNVGQRAKVERYDEVLFVVAQMLRVAPAMELEQVGLFAGTDFLITFQEGLAGDCFDGVRHRLREGRFQIRRLGPGYLAYALLDALVDHYFPALEALGERLDRLEDEMVVAARREHVAEIHGLRRELLVVRRAAWPLREALHALGREESTLVGEETRLHLRDVYDHVVEILDLLENQRELAAGLLEVYLSVTSNKLNEIMKLLTLITTIFIPLSFVAGVYGMNFEHMPELDARWGYPAVLAAMLVVAVLMLVWFWRKGWLGGRSQ